MSFTFFSFNTNLSTAAVNNYQEVTNILDDFTIYDNLGSEFFNQTGDVSLKMLSPLPFSTSSSVRNWLEVRYNDAPFNVYYVGSVNDVNKAATGFDEISGLYSTRLATIQAPNAEDIRTHRILWDDSNTDNWNYQYWVASELTMVQVNAGGQLTDRNGFAVREMILNLEGKVSGKGYRINSITLTLPGRFIGPSTETCIVFQNSGTDPGDPDSVRAGIFTTPRTNWKQIFEIALAGENAYLNGRGFVDSGELKLTIDLTRKTTAVSGGLPALVWSERKRAIGGFGVAGVAISGPDDDLLDDPYELGDSDARTALLVDVKRFTNAPESVDGNAAPKKNYVTGGIIQGGPAPQKFDIQHPGGENKAYFRDINTDSKYSGMVGLLDQVSGSIEYNGEKAGDEHQQAGDTLKIQSLRISERNLAAVVGNVME